MRCFLHFQLNFWISYESLTVTPWCSNYQYCTTSFNKVWTQVLHRFKSFYGVSEICDVENFWQWSQLLEIKLNAFLRSTILQKQFIIIVICLNEGAMKYLIVFINYQSRVSLIQNSVLVSWIGQSNEYQEILETQGLIANCPLEMGLSDWGSWIQSIKRGHLNFSF